METSVGNRSFNINFKDDDHDEEQYKIRSITKRLSISSDFLMTIPASYCDTTITTTLHY